MRYEHLIWTEKLGPNGVVWYVQNKINLRKKFADFWDSGCIQWC